MSNRRLKRKEEKMITQDEILSDKMSTRKITRDEKRTKHLKLTERKEISYSYTRRLRNPFSFSFSLKVYLNNYKEQKNL